MGNDAMDKLSAIYGSESNLFVDGCFLTIRVTTVPIMSSGSKRMTPARVTEAIRKESVVENL